MMHMLFRPLFPLFLGLTSASALSAQSDQPEPNLAIKPEPRHDQMYWHNTFSAQAKKGGIDIVFLGDSITQCWVYEGKELWAERYAPLKAANFGIGSDRTEHVLWRVQNGTLNGAQPKVVVLLIGTNNSKRDTAPQVAEGVSAIITDIRTRLPETKILLLGIFPRAEKPDDPRRLKVAEINTHLAKLDDGKAVFFLDLGPKFLRPDGTLSKGVMHDFLHLTTTGYKIWSDGMDEKLKELLK